MKYRALSLNQRINFKSIIEHKYKSLGLSVRSIDSAVKWQDLPNSILIRL